LAAIPWDVVLYCLYDADIYGVPFVNTGKTLHILKHGHRYYVQDVILQVSPPVSFYNGEAHYPSCLVCSGISDDRSTDGLWKVPLHPTWGPHRTVRDSRRMQLHRYTYHHSCIDSQGRIPPDAFDGEEAVALSQTDQQIRDELAANDDKVKGRMNDEMRKKLEKDRKMISGGGTTQEVVEREDSP
jgi:hypothetical protein